jgi:ribosomal protein S18 acetylase RimI-like enzyme
VPQDQGMSETSDSPAWRSRTADAGDLPFVHEGELAYIREHEPEHEAAWLGAIDRNRELWSANLERTIVLEVDGRPIGYAMWAVLDGTATVVTLHVQPAQRRHGLGRTLLDLLVDDVSANGHSELALGVHRANPARRLYESTDFTAAGEEGDYLLFRRRLPSVS